MRAIQSQKFGVFSLDGRVKPAHGEEFGFESPPVGF